MLIQLVAATLIGLLTAGTLAAEPTDDELTAAWDRLHPSSQRYLEDEAKYFALDDSDRLWCLKIYLQDADNFPRMSSSARETRLAARASDNAPAWYRIDDGEQLSASIDHSLIAWFAFNQELTKELSDALRLDGLKPFIFFLVQEQVSHGHFLGTLVSDDYELVEAVIKNPPNSESYRVDDFVPLTHGLERQGTYSSSYWSNGDLFSINVPIYVSRLIDLPSLARRESFDLRTWRPKTLSPKRLAYEVQKRHIQELPHWTTRRSINPEYTKWQRAESNRSTLNVQINGRSQAPSKYLFEWIERPRRLRFSDN